MGSFRLKKWEKGSEDFIKGYDAGVGHTIHYFLHACKERGIEIDKEKQKWMIDYVIKQAQETKNA